MGALEELKVLIVGSAQGAVAAMQEAGAEAKKLEGQTASANAEMKKLGTVGSASGALLKAGIAGGAAVAGAAIVKFAKDGVDNFANLTGQARSLRLVMGGTAEDASRVAGAARGLGLDVDTVSKGFFQLTKRIADNKDTLAQHGIEIVRDKNGAVDMAKTLINVSEGYKAITDPAERNLFLMQNFGRAGANLIPLLVQGKDALAQLYAQTAKHGEIFSEADLEKGRQYKRAMAELDQAWQGLSATLGRELVPLVTDFAKGLDTVVTAIPGLVSDISDLASGFVDLFTSDTERKQFVTGLQTIGDALGLTSAAAKDVQYNIGSVNEAFAGLNADAAAKKFLEMGVEAAKSGRGVGGARQELFDFVSIAQQDVGVAAQVIQGLKDRGFHTGVYERALKQVAGRQLESLSAEKQLKDQTTLLTGSYDDQIKVLDELQNALLAQYDVGFRSIHAQEQLRDSLNSLNDARKTAADAGGQDAAANEAATRALFATEEQAIHTAAALGQKAEADHQGEGAAVASKAGIDAQKQSLTDLANTLAPDDPLRIFLQQYIDKLNDPAINSAHTATVSVDGLDDAIYKLDTLTQQLGYLTTHDWVIAVNIMGDASLGGAVGVHDPTSPTGP